MIQILFYCLVTSMGQYSVLLTNVNCNHLAINISLQDFSLPPLGFRSQEMDLGLSLPLDLDLGYILHNQNIDKETIWIV